MIAVGDPVKVHFVPNGSAVGVVIYVDEPEDLTSFAGTGLRRGQLVGVRLADGRHARVAPSSCRVISVIDLLGSLA